jgi:hypothetical protein
VEDVVSLHGGERVNCWRIFLWGWAIINSLFLILLVLITIGLINFIPTEYFIPIFWGVGLITVFIQGRHYKDINDDRKLRALKRGTLNTAICLLLAWVFAVLKKDGPCSDGGLWSCATDDLSQFTLIFLLAHWITQNCFPEYSDNATVLNNENRQQDNNGA